MGTSNPLFQLQTQFVSNPDVRQSWDGSFPPSCGTVDHHDHGQGRFAADGWRGVETRCALRGVEYGWDDQPRDLQARRGQVFVLDVVVDDCRRWVFFVLFRVDNPHRVAIGRKDVFDDGPQNAVEEWIEIVVPGQFLGGRGDERDHWENGKEFQDFQKSVDQERHGG